MTTLFIKLFLEEQKERSNDAKNMKKAEVSSSKKTDTVSDSNPEGFTVKVYKCTTCGVAPELCPIAVSEQEASCAVVHETKTSFTSIEKSAFEYKPTQPGWYAIVMDFSSGGSAAEQKVVQLNVEVGGSFMMQEDFFAKLGTRKKETKALQFYLFNVAVDKYLGWAFPPQHSSELDTGLVALNAYRLSKGSSTLPHELGHTFGLWHTFHGTHEQGVYDEDGNKVFEGETKKQISKRLKDFELILKKKIASTKLGNLKKSKEVSMKHMDIKQEIQENPLEFIADEGSCPVCVENPGAPEDHRDRVGDFCADTRPIPKQWVCGNPESSGICGSAWGETPYNNIMSYGKDDCRAVFSKQQRSRIMCYLHTVPKFANMLGIDHVSSVADFKAPAASTMDVAGAESNFDMSKPLLEDIDDLDILMERMKAEGSQGKAN